MDNSRIEVYKIICGNKTFREIVREKKRLAEAVSDADAFNALFSMFLEKLTAQEIYTTRDTKIGLTLFHAPNEQPNTILSAHSESKVIEGYIDGGPYDRLRHMSPKSDTSDVIEIEPDKVITDRYYIYIYLPLGSTYGILFLERKKGQDIHKTIIELVEETLKTDHIIKIERYVPQSLIDEYKRDGVVDTFTFTKAVTSTVPDANTLEDVESTYNVSIQIKTPNGSSYEGIGGVLQRIGNFAFKIGDDIINLSSFTKKKARITADNGHSFNFEIGDDLKIRPSVEVPDDCHNETGDTLNRDMIKQFCDNLRQQIEPEINPI